MLGAAARWAGGLEGLCEALEGLGPSFVKAGQTLATRPDVVGAAAAEELGRLQSGAAPFSSSVACGILEEELGGPPHEVFKDLSPEPVAAASLGQVYRGTTRDGRAVAVKVQRPGALAQVRTDIALLAGALRALRGAAGMSRDLTPLAEEVGSALCGELDYVQEARNLREFSTSLRGHPDVVVPQPLEELSTSRVLTMEWVDGQGLQELARLAAGKPSTSGRPPTDGEAAGRARSDLLRLVDLGVDSSLYQLLESGVLHGDPHPGNLLLTKDGRLAYLDLGQVLRVDPETRSALLACIVHLALGNSRALVAALDRLGLLKPETSRGALELDLRRELAAGGERSWAKFRSLASILGRLGVKYKFLLPPSYTVLVRSLGTLEGVALAADSEFEMVRAAVPYAVKRLLAMESGEVASILAETLPEDTESLATVVEKLSSVGVGEEAFSALPRALKAGDVSARGAGQDSPRQDLGIKLQRLDLPSLVSELDRRGAEEGLDFLSSAAATVAASLACSLLPTGPSAGAAADARRPQSLRPARALVGRFMKQVLGSLSVCPVRHFALQAARKFALQLWQRLVQRPARKFRAAVLGLLRLRPLAASHA